MAPSREREYRQRADTDGTMDASQDAPPRPATGSLAAHVHLHGQHIGDD